MGEYNGNTFEMGRLWGELQTHMRMQTDILVEIKDSLEELPCRISSAIATPQTSSNPSPTIPEITELIRTLYPVILLLAALAVKSELPETGLLKAVLTMVVDGVLS